MFPDSPELQTAVHRALTAALGLTSADADRHLFRSYADPPAADPPVSETVCFYDLQTDADAPQLQEQTYDSSSSYYFTFIPCRLTLVFYGPACEAWAHRCRVFLFQDGYGCPLTILRGAGLHLVPSPRPPVVVREQLAKTYRKRADLVLEARLKNTMAYGPADEPGPAPVPQIGSPPEVTIHIAR